MLLEAEFVPYTIQKVFKSVSRLLHAEALPDRTFTWLKASCSGSEILQTSEYENAGPTAFYQVLKTHSDPFMYDKRLGTKPWDGGCPLR